MHTAGTIGAEGNNGVGITGVAQNVRIMPLRVCGLLTGPNPDDAGWPVSTTAQIQAINYAGAHGARAANMSLGGTFFNAAVRDAFAANPRRPVRDLGRQRRADNEADPHYPCNYDPRHRDRRPPIDNVVCVAASDQQDNAASFTD